MLLSNRSPGTPIIDHFNIPRDIPVYFILDQADFVGTNQDLLDADIFWNKAASAGQ